MRGPPAFLRGLLRLYPRAHRRAYADEMWEVVRYRWAGAAGPVRGTVEAAVDLTWNAARTWAALLGGGTMDGWTGVGLDVRFVLRTLRRSPGYVFTAVVVLAGAVAVNATVFSFVRGTLLYEPPYEDPSSVVIVWGSNTVDGQLRDVISGPNYIDMSRQARSLSAMAAFHFGDSYLTGDGPPEIVPALEASCPTGSTSSPRWTSSDRSATTCWKGTSATGSTTTWWDGWRRGSRLRRPRGS